MRSTLLVLIIALPPVVLAGVTRRVDTPKRFAVVEAGGLYRGAFPTARQVEKMAAEHGIRTIISLTDDDGSPREKALQKIADQLNLKRYRFPMNGDSSGPMATLDNAADALAQVDERPIFFHCAAGDKRSSVTLGAYWMKHKKKSLAETLDRLHAEYGVDAEGDHSALAKQLRDYAAYIGRDATTTTAPGD